MKFALSVLMLVAMAPPVWAMDADELVKRVMGAENRVPFRGVRAHELDRQNMHLSAKVDVMVQDANNSLIQLTAPDDVAGSQMATEQGRARLYFPKEKLLFASDNGAGSHFAYIFRGRITDLPGRLFSHYNAVVMDDQSVAGRSCYVLDFTPKEGFRTPGRRYFIDKNTFQILGEQRSWAPNQAPYFTSQFESFTLGKASHRLNVAQDSRRVELKKGDKNYYRPFPTLDSAAKALRMKLPTPTWIPANFTLKSVEVGQIFGSVLVNLQYDDGLNEMTVLVRPVSNLWVGLLAGAFSFDLIKKFSTFSFLAPYNYQSNQMGEVWAIAYGDLWPEELERTVKSIR